MTIYSSSEAAAIIGTEPRMLRRFLREFSEWHVLDTGGRYSFPADVLDKLEAEFNVWFGKRGSRAPKRSEPTELRYLDEIAPMPVEYLSMKPNRHVREEAANRRAERQRKLQARLNELGMNKVPNPLP